MDTATLRELQAPLKQQYHDDPASALTPVHATATFAEPGITCTVQTSIGPVRAGLHPATGGSGDDACSGDMLLEALLACAGVTLRSVATAMGLQIRSATLHATGQFDARGTLGISREVPVGCTGLSLTADLDTDADDATLERLGQLTERYCVVAHTLREPVAITVRRVPPIL
jgi:uncharacterized OsmC-like protein